jgi:hypothetical protein
MLKISYSWERHATGDSGDEELEKAWLRAARKVFELFCMKQRSYGVQNIADLGKSGVASRLNDKIKRLLNMYNNEGLVTLITECPHCGEAITDETELDTWMDIADYGIIGMMVLKGDWPNDTEI